MKNYSVGFFKVDETIVTSINAQLNDNQLRAVDVYKNISLVDAVGCGDSAARNRYVSAKNVGKFEEVSDASYHIMDVKKLPI